MYNLLMRKPLAAVLSMLSLNSTFTCLQSAFTCLLQVRVDCVRGEMPKLLSCAQHRGVHTGASENRRVASKTARNQRCIRHHSTDQWHAFWTSAVSSGFQSGAGSLHHTAQQQWLAPSGHRGCKKQEHWGRMAAEKCTWGKLRWT